MKFLILIILLVLPTLCVSEVIESNSTESIRNQISQDSCFVSQYRTLCVWEMHDSIQVVHIEDLRLSYEENVRYWFYPWCMSEGNSKKALSKLLQDETVYTKFLTSCDYKPEYGGVIDSLICNEVRRLNYDIFNYKLYSKQVYCYESFSSEKMALVSCFIRFKDDDYDMREMRHFFDLYPYGFHAVINLKKREMKLFVP